MYLATSSPKARPGRGTTLVLACLLGATAPCRLVLAADAPVFEQVFRADFRGQPFNVKALQLVGTHTADLVKPSPDGLRITIPRGLGKPGPIGVVPKFRVRGDFDISGTFEVLKVDRPTEGNGIGIQLLVEADKPTKDAATVAWVYQAGDKGMTFTTMTITGPPAARKYRRLESVPARAWAGTLRLVRHGAIVTTSYRDGPTAPERVLREIEIGSEDLAQVRFAVHTGWTDLPADARLTGLTIAADGLPGYDGTPLVPPGRSPWLLIGGAMALGVIGMGLAAAGMAKRRRRLGAAR